MAGQGLEAQQGGLRRARCERPGEVVDVEVGRGGGGPEANRKPSGLGYGRASLGRPRQLACLGRPQAYVSL